MKGRYTMKEFRVDVFSGAAHSSFYFDDVVDAILFGFRRIEKSGENVYLLRKIYEGSNYYEIVTCLNSH